jgi:hypothetical protein
MKGERTPSEATAREWAAEAQKAVLTPAQAENYLDLRGAEDPR